MSTLRERQLAVLTAAEARPALLVVDVQRSFGDPEHLASFGLDEAALAGVAEAVERAAALVDHARGAGVPVVWVELESAPDAVWHASSWLHTGEPEAQIPDAPCITGTPGAEWYRVAPTPGEARIVKRGYSGFVATELEAVLRDAGITWVTIAGLTTECCVAATAFDAVQRDWPVVIAADATAAYDVHLHDAALESLALNVGLLMPIAEIAGLWTASREGAAA
jgi:nicotinamidase-related amidase